MNETKKPRFNHIAVNGKNGKTGQKYAADLANAMNCLIEAGYSVQLQEHRHFTLVMGALATAVEEEDADDASEHPVVHMLRMQLASADSAPAATLAPRTRELMARFERLPSLGRDIELFTAEVKKSAAGLTAGFRAEELSIAAKELDALRESHTKGTNGHDCAHVRALRAIADALRGVVHTQLA